QRPYETTVPSGYTGTSPVPFVLLLHGYGADADTQDTYFGLSQLAQQRGFILAKPNGLINYVNERFWNATDACCGYDGPPTDDVFYLTAVMDGVRLRYNIDPSRVFVVGHSNGGFMAHRMACDRADRIAGIVSLAGAQWFDLSKCQPS